LSTSSAIPGVPTTNVPQIQFTPQGPIIPNDTDILAGAQEDINYAFGGGLNPALNTPQGQLASSLAAITSDKDSEIAYVTNQVDPQYATGRFQDAIGRIYFMTRIAATSTVVACTLTGLANTVVPAATQAQDTNGNTYTLLAAVTIGSGGTVMGSFANIATGPIPCPAGTLTQVYQAVPGWDAITNPQDGELGNDVESANEFEYRRQNSVALNGRGTTQSILANIFTVAGVLDCYVIDNPSGLTVETGSTNYPLAPHSLYVAVVGGLAASIVAAMWAKKDVGCNYSASPVGQSPVPGNGTVVAQTVYDTSYEYPQPAYQVAYLIPGALPIYFAVQIVNNASLPANIATLIQNAIIAQFNGTNGSQRARIASLILATSYYGVIAGVATNVMLLSVLIGTSANTATATSVQAGIDQAPSISAANISVTLV
jgi:hypothetical protein